MPSQFSEDQYTVDLVCQLSPPPYFLEIGCADIGKVENNCGVLADRGWGGIFVDCDSEAIRWLRNHYLKRMDIRCLDLRVTVENCKEQFSYLPYLGVLSIDIDGNDYWVWKELCSGQQALSPSIVIIEAQMQKPPDEPFVSAYDADYVWDHKTYDHGASVLSLVELGKELGYKCLGKCPDEHSPNLFFVRDGLHIGQVGLISV